MMLLESPLLPLFIFLARVADVSIGTTRLICIMRGHRSMSVLLAFFEVLIWVYAAMSVLSRLDNVLNIIAYAAGFAAGNAVGMWIEQKLAMGVQMVSLLSRGRAHAVAEGLRLAGMPVTAINASGRDGPVAICLAIVARKRVPVLLHLAREIDPEVLATISDVRESTLPITESLLPGKIPLRLPGARWSRRLRGGHQAA